MIHDYQLKYLKPIGSNGLIFLITNRNEHQQRVIMINHLERILFRDGYEFEGFLMDGLFLDSSHCKVYFNEYLYGNIRFEANGLKSQKLWINQTDYYGSKPYFLRNRVLERIRM